MTGSDIEEGKIRERQPDRPFQKRSRQDMDISRTGDGDGRDASSMMVLTREQPPAGG